MEQNASLPPDQDQRDRQEVWEDNLYPSLVRAGRRKALSSTRAGSDTQWYKNILKNPSIRIDARGVDAGFRASPVTGANAVQSVIEKFREKYGAKDVKKYNSQFDAAVVVELTS